LSINQLSCTPVPSRALSHGTLLSRSLKRPKSALLKHRVVSLLCTLLAALRILNSTMFMPCSVVLPTDIGVVEVPNEEQCL